VLSISAHFEMLTGQMILDVALDVFWSNHGSLLK